MQVYLETERMLLRRFTEADVDNLVELDGDPEVMRYLNGGIPTPREVIAGETLPRILRAYDRFPGFGYWAAIEKTSGEFLGWFSFRPPEGACPGDVELGYRLRRAVWGNGFATEGARALIPKGFTELGARRVIAITYAENVASRRVMEKAGMILVRTYRMTAADLLAEETFQVTSPELFQGSDVEYALTKEDWLEQP